jgi:methanogenic corrinoid protein MtbC1
MVNVSLCYEGAVLMETVELFKAYLEHLFAGERSRARELIFDAHDRGFGAERLLTLVIWPAMEQVDRLYREDRINRVSEHLATRINRMIADQLHAVLNRQPKDGRRLVVLCGANQQAELGGQITSDLFEMHGWSVWFVGSDVPNDEVVKFLNQIDPDLLMIYSSLPPEVPDIRRLIQLIREVGVCDQMQVMVCGGIYNRAEDLADEIRADLFAHDIREALEVVEENPQRIEREQKMEPGRRRKRKRKRAMPKAQQLREELGLEDDEPISSRS